MEQRLLLGLRQPDDGFVCSDTFILEAKPFMKAVSISMVEQYC